MWLSDFFAERRGLVCRSSVRACLPYIPNASERITLFSQRIWCGAQHFQRHLWEFVAFFGLNCSTSGLTTTFGYSPLRIAFHPRGLYLPGYIDLFAFPSTFLDVSSASELWEPLRTFCVNTTTVSTAVSFNHFCYFASAFTLMKCASTSWCPPLPFTSQPPFSALLWRAPDPCKGNKYEYRRPKRGLSLIHI